MKTVLIIGASKGIGLETVRRALAAGHEVRAFSRSARSIPVDDPKLQKINGDALDQAAVSDALTGVDAVIQSLGISLSLCSVLRPVTLFSDATRVLIEAMTGAGVKRLICVTGFGAGASAMKVGFLHDAFVRQGVLKQAYDDKDVQEWMIRKSGLDWVIARPGILTNSSRADRYRILTDSKDWKLGTISRAHVAEFLVGQILSDKYIGTTPLLIE